MSEVFEVGDVFEYVGEDPDPIDTVDRVHYMPGRTYRVTAVQGHYYRAVGVDDPNAAHDFGYIHISAHPGALYLEEEMKRV